HFLVGQPLMRGFKTCLQLPDEAIICGVYLGGARSFISFIGNGYGVNPVQLRRVDLKGPGIVLNGRYFSTFYGF
ncbi:hypothetical protein SAMN06265378_1261, partial [Paracoccus sediminis]